MIFSDDRGVTCWVPVKQWLRVRIVWDRDLGEVKLEADTRHSDFEVADGAVDLIEPAIWRFMRRYGDRKVEDQLAYLLGETLRAHIAQLEKHTLLWVTGTVVSCDSGSAYLPHTLNRMQLKAKGRAITWRA